MELRTYWKIIWRRIWVIALVAGNVSGFVIYHSSPVLASAGASLIGAFTEQTLLTVVNGHTTREQAKEAQEQLEQAHAKLVGAILVNP